MVSPLWTGMLSWYCWTALASPSVFKSAVYKSKARLTISSSVSKVILKMSPCSVWAKKKNIDLVLCVAEHTKIMPLSGSSKSFCHREQHIKDAKPAPAVHHHPSRLSCFLTTIGQGLTPFLQCCFRCKERPPGKGCALTTVAPKKSLAA